MIGKLKITIIGVPIYSFAEELSSLNEKNGAFSTLICLDNSDEGFAVSPEQATIVASAVTALASLINLLIYYLDKKQYKYNIIVIHGKGEKIEIANGTTPENINFKIDNLDKTNIERIVVRIQQ